MTLHSMTGFGAARSEATLEDGAQLTVGAEIRSVNHRHLQTKIRLPSELGALEAPLDKRVRARLGRGAVQLTIDVSRTGGDATFDVDEAAVERYLRLQRGVARRFSEFDLDEVDSVVELFGLPGVIVSARPDAELAAEGPEADLVHAVVEEALDALLGMRGREGEAMEADLRRSGEEIASLVERIAARIPDVAREHRTKLVDRVRELAGDAQLSESDLAREVAVLADRLDVSEELTRLGSHLEQLHEVLGRGGAVGRQLDFLAQEFFREANTIGSKCADAEVAHMVVDLKTHVERLREQVQNVE
ncbi:MAG: YicC/YloC family endoribonuclease [Planctomycetota bacterium]